MCSMTKASLAYIATQVSCICKALFSNTLTFLEAHFALTSAQVFSHTDLVTDSEHFYNSIVELLDDPEEREEVDQLMAWWNW